MKRFKILGRNSFFKFFSDFEFQASKLKKFFFVNSYKIFGMKFVVSVSVSITVFIILEDSKLCKGMYLSTESESEKFTIVYSFYTENQSE